MPLYDLKCVDCGHTEERFMKLSEFCNLPECPDCGTMMGRVITPVNVMPDIEPYKSMVTGEYIGSRSTHRKHLVQHKVVEVGNEKLPERKPYGLDKKEKYQLRREIAQIMDAKL